MRSAVLCGLALAQLSGCASLPGVPPRLPDCPGELVDTAEMGGDFLSRERMRVTRDDRTHQLDLVLQKRGEQLVLVGLDPLGVELFSVVQHGDTTRIERLPRAVVAVPPLNALRDVHRAHFAAPTSARVEQDGAVTRIENLECGTETRITRLSERALP